jgi:hypothetical protein
MVSMIFLSISLFAAGSQEEKSVGGELSAKIEGCDDFTFIRKIRLKEQKLWKL